MTYGPGARVFKHNRACPMLWKTGARESTCSGSTTMARRDFKGRNPVWITGGIEKDGTIHWSEPEILLYDENPKAQGMSYPDLIEQDGKFWVTETQKTIARVHPIDPHALGRDVEPGENKQVAKTGLMLSLRRQVDAGETGGHAEAAAAGRTGGFRSISGYGSTICRPGRCCWIGATRPARAAS